MPKFEMEYDVSLNSSLKRLGMEEAFDHRADFSGLLPKSEGDVFIGEVKHKTFARVDEKGAEAAAVTSVRMVLECMIRPVEFAVNEPFAALIADEDTGSVLFAGVINDPQVCKD